MLRNTSSVKKREEKERRGEKKVQLKLGVDTSTRGGKKVGP